MPMTTLEKIDKGLKTIGTVLAGLAAFSASGAGNDPATGATALIPGWLGVIFGFVAMVAMFLAGSPMLAPPQPGSSASPWLTRFLMTVAGLCAAVAGSSFFPQVQAMFHPHVAQQIAGAVTLVGAVTTLLLKSPLITGDAPAS